jgi:hypothetical protein
MASSSPAPIEPLTTLAMVHREIADRFWRARHSEVAEQAGQVHRGRPTKLARNATARPPPRFGLLQFTGQRPNAARLGFAFCLKHPRSPPTPPAPAPSRARRGPAPPPRRPPRRAGGRPASRPGGPPLGALGVERGDEALAAGAQQDRIAQGDEARQGGQQGQVVGGGLAEADARIQPDLLALDPGGHGGEGPGQQEGLDLGDHVVIARASCIVPGSPSMCISTTSQPSSAATSGASGAKRRAATSFQIVAPAATAARATAGFMVSIEIATSLVARIASISGTTRAISSAAGTGVAPGRVLSPPMSRMSAPRRSAAGPGPGPRPDRRTARRPRSCRA